MKYIPKHLLVVLIIVRAFQLINCSTAAEVPAGKAAPLEEQRAPTSEEQKGLVEKWGIKVLGVRLSAAGYMLDFRYRVLDPEKAASLDSHGDEEIIYLLDQASGAKLKAIYEKSKKKPTANRTYAILFSNPGRFVKSGNKVTVVIGDFKAENLTIK
jgi:hypothetical protein